MKATGIVRRIEEYGIILKRSITFLADKVKSSSRKC